MLERLEVRGLGIIDAVELELSPGFAALTGETGAGKSLLVESLKLLSGQRAQTDMVRTGDVQLRVEGWFSSPADSGLGPILEELGVVEGDALVVRREVSAQGRGRAWINDVPVTATALQRIAPHLLAIHGQHEQHGLADATVQRRLVDDFGDHLEQIEAVRRAHRRWSEATAEADRLRGARVRRRDRLDVIAFQLSEIDGVGPTDGEDEELTTRRQILRNAARLHELSSHALAALSDDDAAVDLLVRAERGVAEMADCGLPVAGLADNLREARVQTEEVVREVRGLVAEIHDDPSELDGVESRLHRLEQLMLKYGSPVREVLAHRDRLAVERSELMDVEDRLEAAAAEERTALAEFDAVARILDDVRRDAGRSLVRAVQKVLSQLNMGSTHLEFRWRGRSDERSPLVRDGVAIAFDEDGVDECELLIAANPGEEPRPMARVASGGELSRIHLALRTVLSGRRSTPGRTLLFDEVDSGLGGATASALARLLGELAIEDQVIVVTHLPQVAAAASDHWSVEKVLCAGRSVTRAHRLNADQREHEIARMVAGDEITETALEHARALLGGG